MNKFSSFFLTPFDQSPAEIRQSMKSLLILEFFDVSLFILGIISLQVTGNLAHWWNTVAFCLFFLSIFFVLFFMRKKKPTLAIYAKLSINIVFLFFYIIYDYYTERIFSISRLYEGVAMSVAIVWIGLYALRTRYFIIQGIIANVLTITHYFVLITKYHPEGLSDGLVHLIVALTIINAIVAGSYLTFYQFSTLTGLLTKTTNEKMDAMARVISGYVPICANCKSVREDDGSWSKIESYMYRKSNDLQISHGICDECSQKLYGDL